MKAEFAEIVGATNVSDDETYLQKMSNDIFFWAHVEPAACIVSPGNVDEVCRCVEAARKLAVAVSVRGGGMSYTGGYVPSRQPTVLMDMRRLNRIRALSRQNHFLTVEAGATWADVASALQGTGLRAVFPMPFSGAVSTVGGALSQGTVDPMDGLLGLELVTGCGTVLHTGNVGTGGLGGSNFRPSGPDLTGLFLADAGRFGIKTAVTLELEERPRATAFASFGFDSMDALLIAASDCARSGVTTRVTGLDPVKTRNAPKVGFRDAVKTLAAVAGDQATKGGAMQQAWRLAASGGNFMEGVSWSLHIVTEGVNAGAAEGAIEVCRQRCAAEGREVPNLLPMAMHARPFSVRGFLGPDGERWIPTNGLFSHGDVTAAAENIRRFFESRRAAMDEHGVTESYLLGARRQYSLIEPSLYWRDEVAAIQLEHLDRKSARRFAAYRPNPTARAFVTELRRELCNVMDRSGAAHVQLGKFHPFASSIPSVTLDALNQLNERLDPDGILNPGNLGFE